MTVSFGLPVKVDSSFLGGFWVFFFLRDVCLVCVCF